MTMQIRLLDALRVKHGTDAASARAIGISRQAVSLLRRGNTADDATITAACASLGTDAGPFLAQHRADHATDPATAAAWASVARQLAQTNTATGHPAPAPEPLNEASQAFDINDAGIQIIRTTISVTDRRGFAFHY